MKKLFTLIMVAMAAISVNAQDVISYEDAMNKQNSATTESGYTLAITGNTKKTWSKGNATFNIDGTDYVSIKLSNGAQNTITAPAGKTFNKVTLYSYMNLSVDKLKEREDGTPYIRDAYWKEVNGVNYSLNGAADKDGNPTTATTKMVVSNLSSDDLATVENGSDYKSLDTDNKNVYDKYEFYLSAPVSTMTFTNTGEQVGFVMVLETADAPTAINEVRTTTIDINAPVYNLAGQRVNANYKGVVIKNGKKMLNK